MQRTFTAILIILFPVILFAQTGKFESSFGGSLPDSLNQITDVNVATRTDGQGIKWDAGTGKWIPVTLAGAGTVTSVGLSLPAIFSISGSPVTTSGTLTGTFANQNANLIFAGPASGAASTPSFRSLVDDDIPDGLTASNYLLLTAARDTTLAVLEDSTETTDSTGPNGSFPYVHWNRITGMPAGFADGTDDGGGSSDSSFTSINIDTLNNNNDVATTNIIVTDTLKADYFNGKSATTVALAVNGSNASAGNAILGVDANGNAEGAFDVWTESENTAAGYLPKTTVRDSTVQVMTDSGMVAFKDTSTSIGTLYNESLKQDKSAMPDSVTAIVDSAFVLGLNYVPNGAYIGNTETLISVTWQDGDKTLDFVVDNDLNNYSNANSKFFTHSDTTAILFTDYEGSLKAPLASPTFTGTVTIPSPFTIGATSVTATGTEVNYLSGVTSAIQSQIDSKVDTNMTSVTALGTTAANDDSLWVWDTSTNRLKRIAVSELPATGDFSAANFPDSLLANFKWHSETTPAAGDTVLIVKDGVLYKVDAGDLPVGTHASTHITSGSDEVDGDKVDIDWNPSNYTPSTSPSEASSVDNLTAHLYGIDQKLNLTGMQMLSFVKEVLDSLDTAGDSLGVFNGHPTSIVIDSVTLFVDADSVKVRGVYKNDPVAAAKTSVFAWTWVTSSGNTITSFDASTIPAGKFFQIETDSIGGAAGTTVPKHFWISPHTHMAAGQSVTESVQRSIVNPDSLINGTNTDTLVFWNNDNGATVTISQIEGVSDAQNYKFYIYSWNSSFGSPALVDSVTCSSSVGAWYKGTETTIAGPTVTSGSFLGFRSSSVDANQVHIRITYAY